MTDPTAIAGRGTVVLDLDGVVYIGSTPIAGAAEAIRELSQAGWQVLFATNNSTKTPQSVANVLEATVGIHIDPSVVVTSGMAAAAYLKHAGLASAFVVGSSELSQTIQQLNISTVEASSAESVVVGLDRDLTYETIKQAATAIRSGARFVATNTDATFPTLTGLAPGAGSVVAAIATASGSEFIACGKPHEPMIRLLAHTITSPHVWMVGDRPETDIAFAKAAGWKSALTLTGVTRSIAEVPREFEPDHVLDSLTDLIGILSDASQSQL